MLGTTIIFGLFLGAVVLSLTSWQRGTLTVPSALLWLAVLFALIARQIVLLVDNERLHRILQGQVDERSRSLARVTQESELLLDSVGDGIYGVDRHGLVTFVNPAAARALGLPAAPAHRTPRPTTTFHAARGDGTPYPADGCYVSDAIRDRIATNAEEDTYLRSDGREIPGRGHGDPSGHRR